LGVSNLENNAIADFVKCGEDSRLSFFNILNFGLKKELELNVLRKLLYNIHVLGKSVVFICREIHT